MLSARHEALGPHGEQPPWPELRLEPFPAVWSWLRPHNNNPASVRRGKIWCRNRFYLQLRAPGGSVTQKHPLGRALLEAPIMVGVFRIPQISH